MTNQAKQALAKYADFTSTAEILDNPPADATAWQDWVNETTTYEFQDGSKIIVSGPFAYTEAAGVRS